MKALLSPKGSDCLFLSINARHSGEEKWTTDRQALLLCMCVCARVCASAGGAGLAESKLAALPGSILCCKQTGDALGELFSR